MNEFFGPIIAPQLHFLEGPNHSEKFMRLFFDLYRIEIFKDGLDLILTKMQERSLHFDIKEMKGWDTNVGCFMKGKIILRSLDHTVLAHEMAHAFAHESKIDLGAEFMQCVGHDMKGREPEKMTLKGEVKRLMVDALKSYPTNQFLGEIFARYFELLSISRNVSATGDFTTSEVMDFFVNITNFIEKIFNPQIRKKVDATIAAKTAKLELPTLEKKFLHQIDSRKNPSWSNRINPGNPFKKISS
jgi:hypothetical protein